MRNAKVRKRLAAGKLRLRIRDLRNLGPRSEQLLAGIGVYTADQLRARGALEAFLAVRRAGLGSSLNLLWALVGALEPWPEGCDWREVSAGAQRLPLLLAVESREQARDAVLEAANGPVKRKMRGRAAKPKDGAAEAAPDEAGDARQAAFGNWAPGLPFDERATGERGKKKR